MDKPVTVTKSEVWIKWFARERISGCPSCNTINFEHDQWPVPKWPIPIPRWTNPIPILPSFDMNNFKSNSNLELIYDQFQNWPCPCNHGNCIICWSKAEAKHDWFTQSIKITFAIIIETAFDLGLTSYDFNHISLHALKYNSILFLNPAWCQYIYFVHVFLFQDDATASDLLSTLKSLPMTLDVLQVQISFSRL